jgi:cell division protease FtsH
MSDAVGLATVLPAEGQGPLLPGASETSEATQRLVDEEVRRLLDAAHGEVVELLTEHRESLESLSRALLANETLDEHDAYAAAGVPHSAAFPDGPPVGLGLVLRRTARSHRGCRA